jgi:hypothetical protein
MLGTCVFIVLLTTLYCYLGRRSLFELTCRKVVILQGSKYMRAWMAASIIKINCMLLIMQHVRKLNNQPAPGPLRILEGVTGHGSHKGSCVFCVQLAFAELNSHTILPIITRRCVRAKI